MPPRRQKDPWAVRFGAVIRRIRDDRRWTVVRLARAVGITPAHMSRIEHGWNLPTLHTIVRFAEVFDMRPSALVAETEKESDGR